MMFGLVKQSTHDRAMAAHVATEAGLLERISRLEMEVKNATDLAEMRGRAIRRLEGEIEHQSVNITTLSNENTKLRRKYVPIQGKDGRFQPRSHKYDGLSA